MFKYILTGRTVLAPKADKKRPIITYFVNDQQKADILSKAKQKCKGMRQYVTRDFSKAINEARKDLGLN